ncbi:MAG: hybrid sensor histidine kinase/response regulator, partial [Spirochaetales bacterium]|nr:hybrid sensor histidine kinase/response regulator [Spirochaetales bacterium]
MIPSLIKPENLVEEVRSLAKDYSLLYVEDEESVRVEISEILQTIFPQVELATNGVEALELFQSKPFAVVITDIHMPVMGGLEMIRQMQVLKPQQSFLVTSAYSDATQLIPLINMGVGNFVLKPVDWRMLLAMLRKELAYVRHKTYEEHRRQALEKEVRLRTQEVQSAHLKIARLEEAKANMLALIGHELRTPLNGILGFAEMLRPYIQVDEARKFLEYVDESAKRLERSTRKALEYAGISTENRPVRYEPLPLKELLAQFQAQEAESSEPSSQLKISTEGDLQFFYSDGELVLEALSNILENVKKYAGPEPEVIVRLDREDPWVVLTARDNGPGFSPEALD